MSSLTVDTNCKVIETLGPNLSLVEYSAKSVAVIGDTKPNKDALKELGGKWNSQTPVWTWLDLSKNKSRRDHKADDAEWIVFSKNSEVEAVITTYPKSMGCESS